MPIPTPLRRGLLYVLAVALPSVLLLVLAARGLIQEKELAQKRRADEQARSGRLLGGEIVARLDTLSTQALASPGNRARRSIPGLLAVGIVRDGNLVLPWEIAADARTAGSLSVGSRFQRDLMAAERRELITRSPGAAAAVYEALLVRATDSAAAASVRLRLARALHDAGDFRGSEREAVTLLGFPFDITDVAGVPLALYAASRLARTERRHPAILARLAELPGSWDRLPPAALYLAIELTESLAGSREGLGSAPTDVGTALAARLDLVHRLQRVQEAFPGAVQASGTGPPGGGNLWVATGPGRLVVGPIPGRSEATSTSFPVAIVDIDPLAAVISSDTRSNEAGAGVVVALREDSDAMTLGPRLRGLGVRFVTSATGDTSGIRMFVIAGLALVLLLTSGGAVLLWRDVRREVEVADQRSRFVAAVSHELKTPLTSIRLFAETLRRGAVADERERQEYLDTIVAEGERLSRLLTNVLDYGQIERGEKRYVRRPVSLARIVRDSVRSVEHPLRTQGYQLEVTTEDDLPDALVDSDAIEQAVLNLLSNAIKYSGDSRTIALRLRRDGSTALIEVTDHGIGIPAAEQERIFEQFYRVAAAGDAGIPGSGLGLTLVRHIADAHDGGVTVQSAPNEGSTFTLRLPLVASP